MKKQSPNGSMAARRRDQTKTGMGSVKPESRILRREDVEVDGRPFAMRNTMPAPAVDAEITPEAKTGKRPRLTRELGSSTGRYQSASTPSPASVDQAEAEPNSRRRRGSRDAVRVDEIKSERITIRGAVSERPRIVDATRISRAPLDPRDAFVLQLIDGVLTVPELVDVSGLEEETLEQIIARLIRLGIVAT